MITLSALLVCGKKNHDIHFMLIRRDVVCMASVLAVFSIAVNAASSPRQSSRPEMLYGIFFFSLFIDGPISCLPHTDRAPPDYFPSSGIRHPVP
jgi:hypothetical protein